MNRLAKRVAPMIILGSLNNVFSDSVFAEMNPSQNLKDAKIALSQGQAQAALVEIQSVLKDSPHAPEALLLFAKAKLSLHETQAAITVLQMLRAQGRPWHEWMVPLGIAYLEADHPQKVLDEIWVMDKSTALRSMLENVALLRGHAAVKLNKNDEAKSWYEEVLSTNSKSQDALLGLSKLALNQKDYVAAEKFAQKALEHTKANKRSEVLAYLGEINFKNNKAELAKKNFEESMVQNPKLLSARLGLAQLAFQANQFEQFSKLIEPLNKENNLPVKAQYYLGIDHLIHNRFDEAETAFKRVLQEKPNEIPLMVMAKINIERQLWNEARHHLKQVLLQNPDQKDAKHLLAYVLIQQNEYKEASLVMLSDDWQLKAMADLFQKKFLAFEADINAWKKSADFTSPLYLSRFLEGDGLPGDFKNTMYQNMNHPFSQYINVEAALNRNEIATAEQLANTFFEAAPHHFLYSLAMADIAYKKQDYDLARTFLAKAETAEPTYIELEMKMADCYIKLKQDQAALHVYEHLRSENKLSMDGFLSAADRFHEMRNAIKEEEWLKLTCLKFPNETQPQFRLIHKFLNENRITEAMRRADLLYTQYPNQPEVLQLQGGLARHLGDVEKASVYFGKLTEVQPKEPEAWVFLAETLKLKHEDLAANTSIDKALSLKNDLLPALVLKAKWQLEAKNLSVAMAAAVNARKIAPNNPEVVLLEGDILFAEHKLDDAERSYTLAYQLNPSKMGAFALFRVKQAKGERDASEAILTGFARAHQHDLGLQEEIKKLLTQG